MRWSDLWDISFESEHREEDIHGNGEDDEYVEENWATNVKSIYGGSSRWKCSNIMER